MDCLPEIETGLLDLGALLEPSIESKLGAASGFIIVSIAAVLLSKVTAGVLLEVAAMPLKLKSEKSAPFVDGDVANDSGSSAERTIADRAGLYVSRVGALFEFPSRLYKNIQILKEETDKICNFRYSSGSADLFFLAP